MQDYTKSLIGLVTMGALIAVAKLLTSSEALTPRVIIGRAILGSATSLMAGIVLVQVPNIPPLALLSIGSALGIVGQQYLEKLLRRKVKEIAQKMDDELGPTNEKE